MSQDNNRRPLARAAEALHRLYAYIIGRITDHVKVEVIDRRPLHRDSIEAQEARDRERAYRHDAILRSSRMRRVE